MNIELFDVRLTNEHQSIYIGCLKKSIDPTIWPSYFNTMTNNEVDFLRNFFIKNNISLLDYPDDLIGQYYPLLEDESEVMPFSGNKEISKFILTNDGSFDLNGYYLIGFDVADIGLNSSIFNNTPDLKMLIRKNENFLFQNFQEATAFRNKSDELLPMHAPHFIFAILHKIVVAKTK